MNASSKTNRTQQHLRVRTYANDMAAGDFFEALTSAELTPILEKVLPAHRDRLYGPVQTLSMFLPQVISADKSCQNAVNVRCVQGTVAGMRSHSTNTSSYVKARQRIPTALPAELLRSCTERFRSVIPQAWLWQNRPVKMVDGTTVLMPDMPANQAAYPQMASQKPGLGHPIARLVGVVCLATGNIVDVAMGPYKGKNTSEQALLRQLLRAFEAGDVVLGDACYGTYFLLAELMRMGVDAVFQQNGRRNIVTDFTKGKSLGRRDHLIIYNKPRQKPDWMTEEDYQLVPQNLTVRELQSDGKTLVTTMVCPKAAAKHTLKELYKERWNVELDLRNIKATMGMDKLSCKSPEMVEKEVYVHLLAHNLIRLAMIRSAKSKDLMPRQLSFKHALQLRRAYLALGGCDSAHVVAIHERMSEQVVGNRPGRVEPRAKKARPKPVSLLTKPRHEARAEIRAKGYPDTRR